MVTIWYNTTPKTPKKEGYMTKAQSMAKARAIKTQRVKDRIQSAINILNLYGKKTTIRAIAEEAGVSKTTVQKYLSAHK
jgi:AcrR family transcriptional regulator